jgi:hypothetical protein
MVDLLLLTRVHGWPAVRQAAEEALSLGCTDESAVQCLLARPAGTPVSAQMSEAELGSLSLYDRPMPEMREYDALLGGAR